MDVREVYEASLKADGHQRDAGQESIVALLSDLQRQLQQSKPRQSVLRRLFGGAKDDSVPVRGLYIWGGVGRGKTFLMDLFFDSLDIDAKTRIHFHRMMHDVHERLTALGEVESPLDKVAAEIAKDTRVLCFDEFFVGDIADAMILGRLLEGFFRRGITLVTTSNSAPDDLYKDGLQRQRFLPAIEMLKANTQVVHMAGETDYRLRLLKQAGTYISPDDEAAHVKLQRFFDESATSQISANAMLDINGRDIRARQCAKGIAWFDFDDICDGPRSQNDYIEIARWYPTVIVGGVPELDTDLEDQARRFIALVDEFYDRRVKLIVSAAVPVDALYSGRKLSFEFERTVSRLIEMRSTDYLASPHLA